MNSYEISSGGKTYLMKDWLPVYSLIQESIFQEKVEYRIRLNWYRPKSSQILAKYINRIKSNLVILVISIPKTLSICWIDLT